MPSLNCLICLVPVWNELAKVMSSEGNGSSSILIAQVDMTQQRFPIPSGVEIHGYPTIYLFKRNLKNQPIMFNGKRDIETFAYFLNHFTK